MVKEIYECIESSFGSCLNQKPTKYSVKPEEFFKELQYNDSRHKDTMIELVNGKSADMSASLFGIFGGRGLVKKAYNLLSNDRVDFAGIQSQAISLTKSNLAGLDRVLVAQDTTHINLAGHAKTEGLGLQSEKTLGMLVHSAIACTTNGEPIGLLHQKVWTRIKEEGTFFSLDADGNPKEEKESYRWIETFREITTNIPEGVKLTVIADRECDIYEMLVDGVNSDADFIFRVAQKRRTSEGISIQEKLLSQPVIGQIEVEVGHNSRTGKPKYKKVYEVRACSITVRKPKNSKSKDLPESITANYVCVTEIDSENSLVNSWILATNIPINSFSAVEEIVRYYSLRWRVETFHMTLKSGLGIEKAQQRKFESYKPLIHVYSVIALYIMQLTYVARFNPKMSCEHYFDECEWKLLYRMANKTTKSPKKPYTIQQAIFYLAIIGNGKRAKSDGPPGVKTVWKGLQLLYKTMETLGNIGLREYI
jgi:hypothetical protein